MNALSKIAFVSAVLLGMGTLRVCQSATSRPEQPSKTRAFWVRVNYASTPTTK
ncbi:hypothetical protein FXN70_10695 [Acinetobacter sp. MD2]|nr:hypothetical protein [Acinetobacter sp. MD2]